LSEEKKRRFFYEIAKDAYDKANATLDTLDGKANSFFTLDAALITVVTGLSYFLIQYYSPSTAKYNPLLLTPIALSLVSFVISIGIATQAYSPAERDYVDPEEIIQNSKADPFNRVLVRTALTFSYSASKNSERINKKAQKLELTATFMWLGLLLIVVGFGIFFYLTR